MWPFSSKKYTDRLMLGRYFLTDINKVTKLISKCIKLNKQDRIFLTGMLSERGEASLYVSKAEHNKLIKVFNKNDMLLNISHIAWNDRDKGVNRKIS